MQVEISKETSEKLEKISKTLGVKERDVIDKAVLLYLDQMRKHASLKREMREWDFLSDEALENFENAL